MDCATSASMLPPAHSTAWLLADRQEVVPHRCCIDCKLSKLIHLPHLGLRLTERRHSGSLSQLLCQPSHQQPEFAGLHPAKVCIKPVTIPELCSQDMGTLVHLSCLLDRITVHQLLLPPSPSLEISLWLAFIPHTCEPSRM